MPPFSAVFVVNRSWCPVNRNLQVGSRELDRARDCYVFLETLEIEMLAELGAFFTR
jgi:hypothetical protein